MALWAVIPPHYPDGDPERPRPERCAAGGHVYRFARYCGAYVCDECEDHRGLARCYCGWAASGGDGRAELLDMGEVIDPEEE